MVKRRRRTLPDQIAARANTDKKKSSPVEFISTGSINLNLAISQKGKDGGWARGRIINLVGDGSSGKTLLALEAMFSAFKELRKTKSAIYPPIRKLILVYNNVEGVMDFPLVDMYGEEFVDSIEWIQSPTCEDFGVDYQRRVSALKPGHALIYVADSLDAMISQKQQERINSAVKGKTLEKGTYGTEKSKYFSNEFFNDLTKRMKGKDATLICISQVRQNLDAGRYGKKFYRTGGKALDFYTHQVVWLYVVKKLAKTFRGQERVYGVRIRAQCERNKVSIPYRDAEIVLLFDYGLDDIWSMLDYLYAKTPTAKIGWENSAGDLVEMDRLELIKRIESDEKEYNKLVDKVVQDWQRIESEISIATKRKKRY